MRKTTTQIKESMIGQANAAIHKLYDKALQFYVEQMAKINNKNGYKPMPAILIVIKCNFW